MKHLRNIFMIFVPLLILAAVLFPIPAFGQDTPAPEATAEVAAVSTPQPLPDGPPVVQANNSGTILLVIFGVISVALGGGGLLTMIERFRQRKENVAATEKLGDSVPKEVANKLLNTIDTLAALLAVGREALDGVPADSKPPKIQTFSTDELRAELQRRDELPGGGTPAGQPT